MIESHCISKQSPKASSEMFIKFGQSKNRLVNFVHLLISFSPIEASDLGIVNISSTFVHSQKARTGIDFILLPSVIICFNE